MTENHRFDQNGLLADSVTSYQVDKSDRALYDLASSSLAQVQVPRLLRDNNPRDRLFIANFDGTGNDALSDPAHKTNVAIIESQLENMRDADPRLQWTYVKGPGAQENSITRTLDGARGYTYDERIEEMYLLFIKQARKWLTEDSGASISLIITGFSRGAEEAAGFSRYVHDHGIQDLHGLHIERHLLQRHTLRFDDPPLVPPGQVPQSVALFDPVGTGVPHNRDRRLPPSVVSGFQIVARDERRNAFPSSQIIPPGLSPDGRFLSVTVPGAHSDIGGSYHVDGLAILNGNLMTDFINAHSDVPILQHRPEPEDPSRFVIHRSEEHLWIYRTSTFDRNGERDIVGAQVSPPHCRLVETCAPPEPFDEALALRVGERYPVVVHEPVIPAMPEAVAPEQVAEVEPPMLTSRYSAAEMEAIVHDTPIQNERRVDVTAYDRQRHADIGNIPVASDSGPDTTPASSLQAVSQAAQPDRMHDLQLQRDMEIINERTRSELGPPGREPMSPAREQAQELDHSLSRDRRSPGMEPITTPPLSASLPELPMEAAPAREMEPSAFVAPQVAPRTAAVETTQADARMPPVASMAAQVQGDASSIPPSPSSAEPTMRDPRHASHPDHGMYNAIAVHLAELHAYEGIDLSKEQMDRLSTALLVRAKENGLQRVTDMEFGGNADGSRNATVHAFQAFEGDIDDPRTRWAGIDASKAIGMPVEASVDRLQVVNGMIERQQQQAIAQRQQVEQQQAQGMSLSL